MFGANNNAYISAAYEIHSQIILFDNTRSSLIKYKVHAVQRYDTPTNHHIEHHPKRMQPPDTIVVVIVHCNNTWRVVLGTIHCFLLLYVVVLCAVTIRVKTEWKYESVHICPGQQSSSIIVESDRTPAECLSSIWSPSSSSSSTSIYKHNNICPPQPREYSNWPLSAHRKHFHPQTTLSPL